MEAGLPGILFANWYNNGMEIPVDEAEAKAYWDERLEKASRKNMPEQVSFYEWLRPSAGTKILHKQLRRLESSIQRSSLFTDFETYAS